MYSRSRVGIERKLGRLRFIQGDRASIILRDGMSYAMPADPFKKLGLTQPGANFVLVISRKADAVIDVKIEALQDPRPAIGRTTTPPVYVKIGRKVATRR